VRSNAPAKDQAVPRWAFFASTVSLLYLAFFARHFCKIFLKKEALMCGIYCTISVDGHQEAGQKILAGLKRLEYRGYDSWGVAVVGDGQIALDKHAGKISGVERAAVPAARIGIGHTRWATHGGVSDVNAHPHLSSDESFCVAQNGVVENFLELKEDLVKKGYQFVSQTDTEVIVRLIEEARKKVEVTTNEPTFEIVCTAFRQLTGRNTIAVLTQLGKIFAVRDGSPLVIGKDEHDNVFLSSDVASMAADAREYVALESREAVSVEVISGKVALHVVNVDTMAEKDVHFAPIDVQATQLDKAGHPHFMLKEIHEQALVLHKPLAQPAGLFDQLVAKIRTTKHVYTVGAGSADFVSAQISFLLRQQSISATPVKAYEARSYMNLVTADDLCLAVSQSGETADTVEVVEWMKKKGATIASIVNMPGSTLTRLADLPFMLQIGPEIGIASTKAVTSMIMWGMAVAAQVGGQSLADFTNQVVAYEAQLQDWLADAAIQTKIQDLAAQFSAAHDLFVLGRGQLYMPSFESALKLKEISYIHAEGFSGGELKHGVIALIEKGTPVICLIADDAEKNEMRNAAAEVNARGARVIGVAAANDPVFETWIPLPANQQFIAISSIIPAQLLTYAIALKKNLDPDKPRNLAKSVTVK
jgi:glucosamine--fructose-6-phosphate aminotransferase (isomerizing)